ncbi:MAG: ATP-binding protein [Halobacteriota archaeon]
MLERTRVLVVAPPPSASAVEAELRSLDSIVETNVGAALSRLDDVDCVVCVHGPSLDGLALLTAVRQYSTSIPVVLSTTTDIERLANESISSDLADYASTDGGDSYGALIVSASESDGVDQFSEELVELVAAKTAAALDRTHYEEQLSQLHVAARRLMTALTTQDVADIAVETAHDVLGLEINSVHLLSADRVRLDPVSATEVATDVFETIPSFSPGDSLAWLAFETGEPHVYGDVREAPVIRNPETEMRSELVLPLGRHGVFLAGSTTPQSFDESDVTLAKVLSANVEAGLDRARREELLRKRERELTRQNERLEEFASVVSHDLCNPLSIARGQLKLGRESGDATHFDSVERAHRRMEALIDDLLTLARQGRTVGETESVNLDVVVREVWKNIDGGHFEPGESLGIVEADRDRLRDLLENLLVNAVRHGGCDVTVRVGRLDDDAGFFVADDGPGIEADELETVFERGYTTAASGTGFGLAIVERVAEAHGWAVTATESVDGGARFEIRVDA